MKQKLEGEVNVIPKTKTRNSGDLVRAQTCYGFKAETSDAQIVIFLADSIFV